MNEILLASLGAIILFVLVDLFFREVFRKERE